MERVGMSVTLYLLSDATGETVERVVKACLSQFQGSDVRLQRHSGLRSVEDVEQVVLSIAEQPGLIVFTLVNPVLAQYLHNLVEKHGLDALDLIGPLIFKLSDVLGRKPQQEPGLLHQINSEYYKRMEAVNYTVKQDDGQELRHLFRADIVLVGVSRTSKTPLSIYLAHKGFRVANVPLVRGIEPPPELFQIDPGKVVGLIIDPNRLMELRVARLRSLHQNPRGAYSDYEAIIEELEFSRRLYRQNAQWPVIDVTHKSVEESAAEILKRLNYDVSI